MDRALLLGGLLLSLAWLTVEENSRFGAVGFSLPWAALIARWPRMPRSGPIVRLLLQTTLGGACLGPLAAVLMLLKIASHAHATPDFTIGDVLAMLAWTPAGAALGFLMGIGLTLIRRAGVAGGS